MKRTREDTVLLLGSGALKIGEAGEFDYSGTQAIKALKEEDKEIILVNPNVATVQTSVKLADKIYFLPVTAEFVEKVIIKERPEGILLSFGGQTALNCGIELYKKGILKRHGVEILGTPIETILATEDRKIFIQKLKTIGFETAKGVIVKSLHRGLRFASHTGYPIMIRAGFALGGTASGIAKNKQELKELLSRALATTSQVIIEESLLGWKEVEYEVVRDKNDNCITVCNMENFDPVGIHTGESIVVAPSQTLNNDEYYNLRQTAIDVVRELKIVGECNIQFALHPSRDEYRIIEVNARLSRSSALASKATGYPLAYVAAKLAVGKTLPELKNQVTRKTSAFFEPALDYVVVKIPRWDLDKFINADLTIGSEMKSVGEVMSIARTFEEAIQKATRMLNDGYEGVIDVQFEQLDKSEMLKRLKEPHTMRLFTICSALRLGVNVKQICNFTQIDPWYIEKLAHIVRIYNKLKRSKTLNRRILQEAKKSGFSDKQISDILGKTETSVRKYRKKFQIVPKVKHIDTLAGEFPARTNYLYTTYDATSTDHKPDKKNKKVIVLGCGPYSIGTSVEFDWCAVNTINTLREHDVMSVMVNCNPETVSTDYDYSDYLYFEDLSFERVLDIYEIEKAPFILSVGGQIPNNLAKLLDKENIPILGTKASSIYEAEHRSLFSRLLDKLDIKQPQWGEANSIKQVTVIAKKLGYPILIRPSFVLSGKAMNVIETEVQLVKYMKNNFTDPKKHHLIVTKYHTGAVEYDFDGVAEKGRIHVYAISEHIEPAGIHSGDSTLVLPAVSITKKIRDSITSASKKISKVLKVNGAFNIQYLIYENTPYVIECNLRASRSFPFVSKATDVNFIKLATQILLRKLRFRRKYTFKAVKAAQFSFHKLRGADPVLRVEMSSTGEVAAFGSDVHEAFLKAVLATGVRMPEKHAVFVSVGGNSSKKAFLASCIKLLEMNFEIYATYGTALFLKEHGIQSTYVKKIYEGGHPNISDLLIKKKIDFAVVIPETHKDARNTQVRKGLTDGYIMRRMAIDMGVPIFTNIHGAHMFIESIQRKEFSDLKIRSWQNYVHRV